MFKNYLMSGLALLALASMATACSDDDIAADEAGNGVSNNDGPGAYISVDFTMPDGSYSRTATPDGGTSSMTTEMGQDNENQVSHVVIVLTDMDNNYITHSEARDGKDDGRVVSFTTNPNPVYRAFTKLQKTSIAKFYDAKGNIIDKYKTSTGGGVRVYLICNPVQTILDVLNAQPTGNAWLDTAGEVIETYDAGAWLQSGDKIWTSKNFLMTNSAVAVRDIPQYQSDWDECVTYDSAFGLSANRTFYHSGAPASEINNASTQRGPVSVQRAAARLDYKDGGYADSGVQSLYSVIRMGADADGDGIADSQEGDNASSQPYIDVKLLKMCFVNMGRHFFLFKRTSANGTMTGATVCGDEVGGTAANYVVDYDCDWKSIVYNNWSRTSLAPGENAVINERAISNHFNFPLFGDDDLEMPDASLRASSWYITTISDVLNNKIGYTYSNDGYHIWRYAVENAIPAPEETQVNGLSTGIVFKAKIQSALNRTNAMPGIFSHYESSLHDALDAKGFPAGENMTSTQWKKQPILYLMNNMLYYTWEHVRAEALISALGGVPEWDSSKESYDNSTGVYHGEWKSPTSIATSNADYVSVFGNGGFGKFELTVMVNGVKYSGTIEDQINKTMDVNSPNYRACQWNGISDPTTGDQTGEYRPDGSEWEAPFKKACRDAGITIYQPSWDKDFASSSTDPAGWGYYCYYYYWNRHNDNGQAGAMGPMEFAVIRNNVYKLCVTKINHLGHPRIAENDPNPPATDTPDETDDIYMSVQCEVRPWTIRVNDITF